MDDGKAKVKQVDAAIQRVKLRSGCQWPPHSSAISQHIYEQAVSEDRLSVAGS